LFYFFFDCLFVYSYDSTSIAGVPSCLKLHGHPITAHHSYAFSTSKAQAHRERQIIPVVVLQTNKQTNE